MDSMTTWELILTLLGSSAVSGVIIKILDYVIAKKQRKDEANTIDVKAMNEDVDKLKIGNQVLLRFRIKSECVGHIKAGWIDGDDLDLIKQMHAAYKALGGNGYLDSLMKRLEQLPLGGNEHEND